VTGADQHRSFIAERWPELGIDAFVRSGLEGVRARLF
jgi:hypothetical protein